jgi:CheY-like chemotaxis protein
MVWDTSGHSQPADPGNRCAGESVVVTRENHRLAARFAAIGGLGSRSVTQKKVLVIDDEIEFGRLVGRVARELGQEVEITTNATQFMESITRFKPDLIVMDMVMPDTEGIELIRWLTKAQYKARVIVATGYNPEYAKMAALMAKAEGILEVSTLAKPVRLVDLRAALTAD